jgi:hypothetical protein
MRKYLIVIGCGFLAACLGPSLKPGSWPASGPYVCVVNGTESHVRLAVRDARGHELDKGRLAPRARKRFLWPFIDLTGGFFVARTSEGQVMMSHSFKPWGPKAWGWDVATPAPVSAPRSFCPAVAPDAVDSLASGGDR